MNRLRKQSLAIWGLHFWQWSSFLGLYGQTLGESCEYWNLAKKIGVIAERSEATNLDDGSPILN